MFKNLLNGFGNALKGIRNARRLINNISGFDFNQAVAGALKIAFKLFFRALWKYVVIPHAGFIVIVLLVIFIPIMIIGFISDGVAAEADSSFDATENVEEWLKKHDDVDLGDSVITKKQILEAIDEEKKTVRKDENIKINVVKTITEPHGHKHVSASKENYTIPYETQTEPYKTPWQFLVSFDAMNKVGNNSVNMVALATEFAPIYQWANLNKKVKITIVEEITTNYPTEIRYRDVKKTREVFHSIPIENYLDNCSYYDRFGGNIVYNSRSITPVYKYSDTGTHTATNRVPEFIYRNNRAYYDQFNGWFEYDSMYDMYFYVYRVTQTETVEKTVSLGQCKSNWNYYKKYNGHFEYNGSIVYPNYNWTTTEEYTEQEPYEYTPEPTFERHVTVIEKEYPLGLLSSVQTFNKNHVFSYQAVNEKTSTNDVRQEQGSDGILKVITTTTTTETTDYVMTDDVITDNDRLEKVLAKYGFSENDKDLVLTYMSMLPGGAQILAGNPNEWGSDIDLGDMVDMPFNPGGGLYVGTFTRTDLVKTAKSLLGLNYFWGGKYNKKGFNPEWGKLYQVTAPGSYTTGKYIPLGLDCSGFVDWVYYQYTEKIMSKGNGCRGLYANSTPIPESELKPGDIGLYPGLDHVGIFIGRDNDGTAMFIHAGGRTWGDATHPTGQVIISKQGERYNGYAGTRFTMFRRLPVQFLDDGGLNVDGDDLYWMSRVIYAEAGGEPWEGQIAVGRVVMNRVRSPRYPNTVKGVIFQPGQFTCVRNGHISKTPSQQSIEAAKIVLAEGPTSFDYLSFKNPMGGSVPSDGVWIGHHVFYNRAGGR